MLFKIDTLSLSPYNFFLKVNFYHFVHCMGETVVSLFGAYLVHQKLATPKLIVEALDRQRVIKRPIAAIAREQRLLDMNRIFQILNWQVKTGRLFGKIAVEKGFLSKKDVNRLLSIQKSEVPHLGEILIDMGIISPVAMESALNLYLNESE